MSAPGIGASQAVPLEQYINTLVLHKALPYPESAKPAIRSHVSNLLREFPSLQVKIDLFSQGEGRSASSLLLQLFGTIPISFLQVVYNIPVVFWLSEQYPFCAPIVFVVPSPFMIIKTSHRLVGLSGLVSCSLLHTWAYPTSNLVELVRGLSTAFGQDPPLYSIYCAPDGDTPMSAPSSSSTSVNLASALPASSSSLLSPISLSQPPPPAVSPLGLPRGHSLLPSLPFASLLGPGSSSQQSLSYRRASVMRSSFAETRPLLQQHPSYNHGFSMTHQQRPASLSSTSAGSVSFLPAAQQQPPNRHNEQTSMDPSSSLRPMTSSLLGPGKFSERNSLSDAGRSGTEVARPVLQASGLLIRPDALAQRRWYSPVTLAQEASSMFSTSNPTSLLGPGKTSRPFPFNDARHFVTLPPLLPASSFGRGQSLCSTSQVSIPSTVSLDPILCNGHVSQSHSAHSHMGVSLVPAAENSASGSPRMWSQHIKMRECQNTTVPSIGTDDDKPPSSSLVPGLLSMPNYTRPLSTSAHQRIQSPTTFSNPLLDDRKYQPTDRRQPLMNTLMESLHHDIGEIRMIKEKDMLKLMNMECLLKHRQMLYKDSVEILQQQKENLEVQLQNVLINTELLETWLLNNSKSNVKVDMDDIWEPFDGLSHQLLECMALDLAIEDAIYCLDRSAQDGIVTLDSYLKLVRTLCREQFFQRALAVKVTAAQEQN